MTARLSDNVPQSPGASRLCGSGGRCRCRPSYVFVVWGEVNRSRLPSVCSLPALAVHLSCWRLEPGPWTHLGPWTLLVGDLGRGTLDSGTLDLGTLDLGTLDSGDLGRLAGELHLPSLALTLAGKPHLLAPCLYPLALTLTGHLLLALAGLPLLTGLGPCIVCRGNLIFRVPLTHLPLERDAPHQPWLRRRKSILMHKHILN